MNLINARPHLLRFRADLHTNSTVAVSPASVQRDDGDVWRPSKVQRWLNRCWLDFYGQTNEIARQHGAIIHDVFGGDVTEGDHHDTFQIISRNPATQVQIALDVLEPVIQTADLLYFVRGTPVHVGGQAYFEELIGRDLDAYPDANGNRAHYILRLNLDGVRFAIAHHRRQNRLPWTMGGSPNRLAVQTLVDYVSNDDIPPDVVIRAHGHKFDESSRTNKIKVVFSPAWKLTCEFVHKIAPDAIADIGGLWFLCNGGRVERWDRIQYRHKRPAYITPELPSDQQKPTFLRRLLNR